jgi:hypothetical protein
MTFGRVFLRPKEEMRRRAGSTSLISRRRRGGVERSARCRSTSLPAAVARRKLRMRPSTVAVRAWLRDGLGVGVDKRLPVLGIAARSTAPRSAEDPIDCEPFEDRGMNSFSVWVRVLLTSTRHPSPSHLAVRPHCVRASMWHTPARWTTGVCVNSSRQPR